jgi:hypothetical protein
VIERDASESLRLPADRLTLFRELNDDIGESAEQETAFFVCECSSHECFTTLELSVRDYRRIRTNPTWALVTPGHQLAEVERVVSEGAGFAVVERLLLTQPDETSERSSSQREWE